MVNNLVHGYAQKTTGYINNKAPYTYTFKEVVPRCFI